ncbi:MAG: DNA polymerase III subunit delta [Promethearchaeota archaeon]|jgi:DNA polymerase III delta subunit
MNKPVFWICGNRFQCDETWKQVIAQIRKKSGETPNIESLYCGTNTTSMPLTQCWATATDIIQALRNKDLFDTRPRVIKVIGLPEDYTGIVDWLRLVNGRNVLVFWGPFGYIKSGSTRWVSAKTSKLYKTIKSDGKIVEHPLKAASHADAVYWIKQRGADWSKEFNSDAARRMVELQGKDLDVLTNSIEKLSVYQKGKTITTEDVEACCFSDYSDEVWSFLDDLDRQNLQGALAYLQRFYEEGDGSRGESFYGRVSRLFGALIQHFQFLLLLKDVCGKTLNASVAYKELSTFKKMTPTKIQELCEGKITFDELESRFTKWYVDKQVRSTAIQAAFLRRKSEIYRIVSDLYDCMYWSRRYSGEPTMVRLCLDTFVLLVCGKLSSNQVAQIRGHE